MSYTVKDAQDVMEELGSEFTLKAFLQTVTQHRQKEYIDLMYRCKDETSPFNAAHRHFGQKLSEIAQKAGYDFIEEAYVEDIFGNRNRNVI
jgi:hypothetical protein